MFQLHFFIAKNQILVCVIDNECYKYANMMHTIQLNEKNTQELENTGSIDDNGAYFQVLIKNVAETYYMRCAENKLQLGIYDRL